MTNKSYHLTESKTFCMAPWVHTHIWPNGDVYPCCMSETDKPVANYKTLGDLKSVWNSEKYKSLRKNMINDTESTECSRCYEQEKHGKYNLRKQLTDEYGHLYDLVSETQEDGHLETLKLHYLDIRFSNICNLTCRTCGPDLSSSWGLARATKFPEQNIPAFIRIESSSKNKEFWDDLSQYIEHVDRIYFAGGEPLLMQEHYNMLDYLVERELFDIKIYYNTNFSTLDFKGASVLEYWKKFNKIVVCASLDGSHEQGEFIRKGLEWDKVVENRIRMKEECPNVRFILAPTISVFNADHVLDFYNEWVKMGLVEEYDIQFNVLLFPPAYRIALLPDDIKASVVNKIDSIVKKANDRPEQETTKKRSIVNQFLSEIQQFKNALLIKLDDEEREKLLIDLNNRINELDTDRNESTWETFPNLITMRK